MNPSNTRCSSSAVVIAGPPRMPGQRPGARIAWACAARAKAQSIRSDQHRTGFFVSLFVSLRAQVLDAQRSWYRFEPCIAHDYAIISVVGRGGSIHIGQRENEVGF